MGGLFACDDLRGKKVTILFDDLGKVVPRTGTLNDFNFVFLIIDSNRGLEVIPIFRVIRIELNKSQEV